MTIWVHRYALVPRRPLSRIARTGKREGALLRIDDGFADLHPWAELGDVPLEEQLALLERGVTTPMTDASLRLAKLDADARRRGVSLFAGLTIPESHWSGPDVPAGFDTVKIKDAAEIPPQVRIRIDFNGSLSPEQFSRIATTLPKERIDFVEDPVPWEEPTWRRLRRDIGIRLALDRDAKRTPPRDAVDVVVHKPALAAAFPEFDGEIVVTSYMDHPVGQFGAAFVAASNRVSSRCGLMTHVLFERDAFIDRIRCDGARLVAPSGTGIGFDDLLEKLPWKKLA